MFSSHAVSNEAKRGDSSYSQTLLACFSVPRQYRIQSVGKNPGWGVSPIADVLTSLCPAKFVQKTDYNLQTEESLRNPAWTHTRQKPPPFFSNSANEFTPFDVNNDILLYCISSYICLPVRGITHFYSAPIYFLSTSTAK